MKRNPHLVYAVVLLTAISFAVGQFKVPPTLHAVMGDMGIGLTQGGLLMSIVAITAILLALFGGMLTVRFRPKTLALVAVGCALAGNLIGYLATNFEILLLSRLLEGLGYGMQTAVIPTIIAELYPAGKRRVPMALYSVWVSLGMLFIFNFSSTLIVNWGWRSCWLFCGFMFAAIFVLFALVVKTPESSELDRNSSWAEEKKAIGIEVRNGATWCLTLVFSIFGFGCAAFTTFAPTFCIQSIGMDPIAANTDTGFLSFGMLAGGFLMAALLGIYKGSRPNLLLAATILTGVFFVLAFTLSQEGQVLPFCLVFGVVLQTIPPITFAIAPETAVSPKTVGVALGIATSGDHLGSLIGTVVLGGIVEMAGNNWACAIPTMGVFALIGILGALGYRRQMKKRQAHCACEVEPSVG